MMEVRSSDLAQVKSCSRLTSKWWMKSRWLVASECLKA
jgi:hypothetical protein